MTGHVMSRWYRAPEIIVQEPEYGYAVDIWSVGVILGEMLRVTDAYKTDPFFRENRFMFRGYSCFPMSPCAEALKVENKNLNIVEKDDMIVEILKHTNPMTQEDLSFLTTDTGV